MTPRFDFRRLTDRDIPMLFEWLQRPHVRAWWHDNDTVDDLREDYLIADDPRDPKAYIAYAGDAPLAFVQSYVAIDAGDGWWPDQHDRGVLGIDVFIADEENLGRGLGTELVKQFTTFLFSDPNVTRIQIDPSPDNAAAIRAYEKAGFRRDKEVVTPDGPALLMTAIAGGSTRQTRQTRRPVDP